MKKLIIFLSNMKERIFVNLFNRINSRYRYVIIEGDTTEQEDDGDYPVSNAGITISRKISHEIFENVTPYENLDRYPDYYCALVYKQKDKKGSYNYCIAVNPDMSGYKENPILSPIQYDQKWHTSGFQPCTPTTMYMLNSWKIDSREMIALPVKLSYDFEHCCYYYLICNPCQRSIYFKILSFIIRRNTFRFPDNKTKSTK